MIRYLDSSAIVKLVQPEAESRALLAHIEDEAVLATSALARVEVLRAVHPDGEHAASIARDQLDRFHQVAVGPAVLDRAAFLAPGTLLRSLDAIHVATATLIGSDLLEVVTYDRRMAGVCHVVGMPTAAPA
ncbi:hypothetical protein B7486_56300 [cyanobacterium TDX16]|nr:hypothetical protein B7486_56300 [cyanobacterium TDX16]